jgi:hypothetical protein
MGFFITESGDTYIGQFEKGFFTNGVYKDISENGKEIFTKWRTDLKFNKASEKYEETIKEEKNL